MLPHEDQINATCIHAIYTHAYAERHARHFCHRSPVNPCGDNEKGPDESGTATTIVGVVGASFDQASCLHFMASIVGFAVRATACQAARPAGCSRRVGLPQRLRVTQATTRP